MGIRQSSSAVARIFLLARHGRKRAGGVLRGHFDDLFLLLIAVAIALVIRRIPTHQALSGLEDAGWAAVAIALYLPIVFFVGAGSAARRLRRWDVSHTPIVQGVRLDLAYVNRGIIPGSGGRCVVHCSDGSIHEASAPLGYGKVSLIYNASFPSTGVYPPHGTHVAHWYIKEAPQDGWIKVAEDTFTYAPATGE